jgi:hypothetical protein
VVALGRGRGSKGWGPRRASPDGGHCGSGSKGRSGLSGGGAKGHELWIRRQTVLGLRLRGAR